MRKEDAYNPGYENLINHAYPEMKKRAKKLREKGHYIFDLYDIYVDEPQRIFTDHVHVNKLGNEIMAKKIAEIMSSLDIFN